jgi:hypothetical protein
MPRIAVALLGAAGASMFSLLSIIHGARFWIVFAFAAAATGLAVYFSLSPRPGIRRAMSQRADTHAELLAPMTLTVAPRSPDGPSPAIAPCHSIASYMANSSQTHNISFGPGREVYIDGVGQPAPWDRWVKGGVTVYPGGL